MDTREFDSNRKTLTKTFVLGAGFSAAQDFPLVGGLKDRVVRSIEAERHALYRTFLEPGNGGHTRGQFYAGLDQIQKAGKFEFEELLIALRHRLKRGDSTDPCHVTEMVLRSGCARLLWCIHNSISRLETCYIHFSKWLAPDGGRKSGNAIASFNWDVLAERTLYDSSIPWGYCASLSSGVPILKPHGSINWSRHLQENLRADYPDWLPIGPASKLCFDAANPFANPDLDEANPDHRCMISPGDPELPVDDSDILQIWKEAEETIRGRDILIFIGYSLPAYDSYALDFFKRVSRGKVIEVYNPSKEHLVRFRDELGSKVRPCPQRFKECIYAKPPC
jgi:hypothetical protein